MKRYIWTGFVLGYLAIMCVSDSVLAGETWRAEERATDICVIKTTLGTMTFSFFDEDAPRTVAQFKSLVEKGFYDGKDFYRVVRGHVIQAGGGDAPPLPPEFNARPHVFGALGLGRTGDEASGDSEFYVCVAARPYLDGRYTVFGRLVEGDDVLERIAAVPVKEVWEGEDRRMAMHRPVTPVVIEKAWLEKQPAAPAGFPEIFGVAVRLFYRDPAAAALFYGNILGLDKVREAAGTTLFKITPGSFLEVAPLAAAGPDGGAPKTATLSFVTDEVDGWFAYLKSRGVAMRSELADSARHPTRGFVAADPEGHALEFERFLDDPRNYRLRDVLRGRPSVRPAPETETTRPAGLGIRANIIWLYYRNLAAAKRFLDEKLSAGLLADLGNVAIYSGSPTGFIGLAEPRPEARPASKGESVRVVFFTDSPRAWASVLARRGAAVERPAAEAGTVLVREAGGHALEFRRDAAAENPRSVDAVLSALYGALTFPEGGAPDLALFRSLYLPDALCVRVNPDDSIDRWDIGGFIASFRERIRKGSLKSFHESEIARSEDTYGRLARVRSVYRKGLNTADPKAMIRGVNELQLVFRDGGWRIAAIAWMDERPATPLPEEWLRERR
jgi:cyclophilin family peptidyl-prolyl cis-trans isomerase